MWDEWSATDPARYHAGECARRWQSFQGSATPVTGATIVKMAKGRGWAPGAGSGGNYEDTSVRHFQNHLYNLIIIKTNRIFDIISWRIYF